MISFLCGFVAGSMTGVCLMCLLQVKRLNGKGDLNDHI